MIIDDLDLPVGRVRMRARVRPAGTRAWVTSSSASAATRLPASASASAGPTAATRSITCFSPFRPDEQPPVETSLAAGRRGRRVLAHGRARRRDEPLQPKSRIVNLEPDLSSRRRNNGQRGSRVAKEIGLETVRSNVRDGRPGGARQPPRWKPRSSASSAAPRPRSSSAAGGKIAGWPTRSTAASAADYWLTYFNAPHRQGRRHRARRAAVREGPARPRPAGRGSAQERVRAASGRREAQPAPAEAQPGSTRGCPAAAPGG